MRYAAIDLGTNTFDLLIVDCTNDSWEVFAGIEVLGL